MQLKGQNKKNESGFVFLESLISLSILTMVFVSLIPFLIDILHFREDQKEKVEIARVMYDSSSDWNGKNKKEQWVNGEEVYDIHYTNKGIAVRKKGGKEMYLEVLSIHWNE